MTHHLLYEPEVCFPKFMEILYHRYLYFFDFETKKSSRIGRLVCVSELLGWCIEILQGLCEDLLRIYREKSAQKFFVHHVIQLDDNVT